MANQDTQKSGAPWLLLQGSVKPKPEVILQIKRFIPYVFCFFA